MEIITPFFLGLSIFTLILLMGRVLKLTEMVVSKGAKLGEVGSLVLYILPSFLVVTIPMAFLLAVLLAFGRLSSDEEITVAKSSGISLIQMMPPVIVLSLITFVITLFLMVQALPWGNYSFKKKIYDIVQRKADTNIVPGRVVDSFEGMILYVTEKDIKTGKFKGVLLSDEKEGSKASTITAKSGEIISSPDDLAITLRLYDGTIHRKGSEALSYKTVDFNVYDITLNMAAMDQEGRKISKGDRELTLGELLKRKEDLEKKGISANSLMVELHKKFSIPFACIVFAFIGAPLGVQGRRSGKAHGFTISLALIVVYWIFLIGGEALGDQGKVSPFLGMWAPNIFFLSLGIYLMLKVNSESEIRLLTHFEKIYGLAIRFLKSFFKQKKKEEERP